MSNEKGKGLRYNEGKLRFDLFPPFARRIIAQIFTKGAEKYALRNWENGMPWSSVEASLERHYQSYKESKDFDPEDGMLHIAKVAWNAIALTEYYKIYPQGDDRPHRYLLQNKIGLDIDEVLADFVGALMDRFPDKIKERSIYWNDTVLHECFAQVRDDENFWLSIKPTIKELPFEPHCYITSRSVNKEITQKWLDMNGFPHAPLYAMKQGESKVEAAKKSGCDVFVDDCYEHFIDLNRNGIFCYLFDAPHNRRYDVGFRRIKSLSELVDFNNIQNNNYEH